ncbi:indoleamine 2,3-dioxygenase beta type [Clohesyomyces aquaticus]|uniref:Indoleamine 2,3-dioxygenase n=1 Tax=Clohesyomyces aquaticus TaxID=1231657 RepID=A0A1Y2A6B2_9PLEO|nr:indoleamine 2,3-dioxygenase beta type [Clohesyomyces aquaticus]
MSPHKIQKLPSPASLASYGISKNGFLPEEPPLRRLPNDIYEPWERIAERLPELIRTWRLRSQVDTLPCLDIGSLDSEAEWQRAYLLLAIMAQGYIWQGPEPSERLPAAIAVPLLHISEHIEVHPVATYAALNLWNWKPTKLDADLTRPDDMVALNTATGTDDESWFFVISNAMEARAGPLIRTLTAAMEAVEVDDVSTILHGLQYFTQSLVDIGKMLKRMDERCDPQVFYHTIRPFLAGSMNMEAAGLPKGVFYDEGNGKGSWRKYRGGSNGQSSLLQFFDAVLSVNHSRCGDFHAEMRSYMPGPHARFLDLVEANANIRAYVDEHQDDLKLVKAFNDAIAALAEFRNVHIALVSRYIIIPSRMVKPGNGPIRKDLASASTRLASEKGQTEELIGTGGTKLIPFLRTSRDETNEAAVL